MLNRPATVNLPALCNTCGAVFMSPIRLMVGATDNTFRGNKVPCRTCGGKAEVPDGVYSVVDRTKILLRTTSAAGATRFLKIVRALDPTTTSPGEVAALVKRDAADFWPLLTRITDKPWFWAVLTGVIVPFVIYFLQDANTVSPEKITEIAARAAAQAVARANSGQSERLRGTESSDEARRATKKAVSAARSRKPRGTKGTNTRDFCPCRSGRLRKNCCDKASSR